MSLLSNYQEAKVKLEDEIQWIRKHLEAINETMQKLIRQNKEWKEKLEALEIDRDELIVAIDLETEEEAELKRIAERGTL